MQNGSYISSSWPTVQLQSRNDENKRTGGNSKQSKFFPLGERSLWYRISDKAIYEYKDPRRQFYNIALKIIKP